MHLQREIDTLIEETKVLKSQMQSMTPRHGQQKLRKEIEIKEVQFP